MEQQQSVIASTKPPSPAHAAQQNADEKPEDRYYRLVEGLVNESLKQNSSHLLLDVLARGLACIAYAYGPRAVGEAMVSFGSHIKQYEERFRAHGEAEEAKKAGQKPN